MNKASNPVVKDGLGILARLMVIALLLGVLSILLQGCSDQCETYYTYTDYQPVTVNMAEVKAKVGMKAPRTLTHPGKIYMKDNFIFISEAGEGVHIIDNSDKTNPVFKAFVEVPGSFDMAVLGSILYTDSYTDLVAFDIADVNYISELSRKEGVFKSRGNHYYYMNENSEMVVDYKPVLRQTDEPVDCDEEASRIGGGSFFDSRNNEAMVLASSGGGDVVNQGGKGGSMARFALQANHLYALDNSYLYIFDLQNPFIPEMKDEMYLSWIVETIFPYEQDKLFIGTSNGIHILDNANPSMPKLASSLEHFTACDPVVVENDIAYVTLRTGNACTGSMNQLDVIDVSDIYNPKLLESYPMENPHGLGIDNGRLFICEGEFGLKVFDATDIYKIGQNLVEHRKDIHAFDVIPYQDVLLLIGEGGFYQYDYSDIDNIKLLSHIAVVADKN